MVWPKFLELTTLDVLRNDYVQQGCCALDHGLAEISRAVDARVHRKIRVMLCSPRFDEGLGLLGVIYDDVHQFLL